MAPFDSGFDPRQRRHLIRAQLVSQLIRVQLEGNLPFLGYFLAKELHEWLNTRRKWKFIQKYMKKRSKRVGAQISECSKDVKNGVCEISQTLKRAAKYFRINKLNSHRCEVGFHLVVFGFHRGVKLQGKSKALCKRAAKFSQQKADSATLC
uniref:Uncharacterized protein n=1 Tax=Vitis vinifera TaxID=29760 RepID=A5BY87_VITVI|nr:hypothetical protein VITISV_020510 [Vitis vinifera]